MHDSRKGCVASAGLRGLGLALGTTLALAPQLLAGMSACSSGPSHDDILEGMRNATHFMVDKVAFHGGYVWAVSEDFSRRWGEIPARPSQIWVQSATPDVGLVLLDAYAATQDPLFLDGARKAADALITGQHPAGGWHYFIDFDPDGVPEWYEKEASRFMWGYEEYRHYYGNCTFDDGTTADPTRLLLRLHDLTKDPALRGPLLKALDFILAAQYPNGAWPQRFPLKPEFEHDGFIDYTPHYTLNDGVARNNIEVLLEAHRKLGDRRYLDAATRGVDFLIAVQGPVGQAAWAEQYGPDLKPAAARTHEPAGYVIRESLDVVHLLKVFFLMTGDERYLKPIAPCLDWIERVKRESLEKDMPLARYYQPGTNLPIYVLTTDRVNAEGYGLYEWSTERPAPDRVREPARGWNRVNVAEQLGELQRLSSLSRKQALAELDEMNNGGGYEENGNGGWNRPQHTAADVLRAMDGRGAWVTDDVMVLTVVPQGLNPGTREPVRAIDTGTFVRNMRILIRSL